MELPVSDGNRDVLAGCAVFSFLPGGTGKKNPVRQDNLQLIFDIAQRAQKRFPRKPVIRGDCLSRSAIYFFCTGRTFESRSISRLRRICGTPVSDVSCRNSRAANKDVGLFEWVGGSLRF